MVEIVWCNALMGHTQILKLEQIFTGFITPYWQYFSLVYILNIITNWLPNVSILKIIIIKCNNIKTLIYF